MAGGAGSRRGAKCEAERVRGFTAKTVILDAMKGGDLAITYNGEVDDSGRKVAIVIVGGRDLGAMGVAADHLRPCVFNGKRATMPKPNWCP